MAGAEQTTVRNNNNNNQRNTEEPAKNSEKLEPRKGGEAQLQQWEQSKNRGGEGKSTVDPSQKEGRGLRAPGRKRGPNTKGRQHRSSTEFAKRNAASALNY
ncbi:hypothetical protein ABZP36_008516 [Zizania latifolia]